MTKIFLYNNIREKNNDSDWNSDFAKSIFRKNLKTKKGIVLYSLINKIICVTRLSLLLNFEYTFENDDSNDENYEYKRQTILFMEDSFSIFHNINKKKD